MNKQIFRAILLAMVVVWPAVCLGAESEAQTEAQAAFKSLYGEEVARAMRTSTTSDDIVMAGKLLEASGSSRSDPALLKIICDTAYDLGKRNSAGYDVALEAMNVLVANAPDQRVQCLDKIVVIHQSRYSRSPTADRPAAASVLFSAMMEACDANAESGNFLAAKLICRKASSLAISARMEEKDAAVAKYKELVASERTEKLADGYAKRLKADPSHIASREALINIYLIDKNDPTAAAKWLDEDCDERLRSFIPMAAGDINAIATSTLMEMGDWYKSLAADAQISHKGGLLLRAQGFYEMFMQKYTEPDMTRTKAALALSRVQAEIKKYGVKVPTKTVTTALSAFSGISRKASVSTPTKLPGVKAWTVEVRDYLGDFNDVEFTKIGDQLITAGQDGSIRFWDVETGKLIRVLMGHDDQIKSLVWSRDRKILASGSYDKTIRLWDVVSGKNTTILRGATESIYRIAWSPDSQMLASSGRGTSVQIWSVRAGKAMGSITATDYMRALDWNSAGVLATGTADGNVSLWNVRSGKPYGHYPLDQYQFGSGKKKKFKAHSVGALAYSPTSSKLMAVCFSTGTVKQWKTGTRTFLQIMTPEKKDSKGRNRPAYPTCVQWSPNARMLAVGDSGERGGDVWIWHASGTQKHKIDDHGGSTVSNLAWSPDGKHLATASSDGTSNIIDPEAGNVIRKIQSARSRGVARPIFSSDGTLMAYACRDKTIRIWDIVQCKQVSVISTAGLKKYITKMSWSPDGAKIAFLAYYSSHVNILDVKSGVVAASFDCGYNYLHGLAWSPDSKKLYVSQGGSERRKNGLTQAWDVALSKVEFTLSEKKIGSHYGLAISPDGKTLVSSASYGKVHFWDLVEKKYIRTLPADSNRIRGMTFSPDGSKFATCGDDRTVKVWTSRTGNPIFGLQKHESYVHRVAFSADSTKLASADDRGNIAVWDMTSGKNVAWFRGANWKLRWMRDSQTLAAASGSSVAFYNAADGGKKGTYYPMPDKQGLIITASGNYSGTPGVEKNLIYQAQTVSGQATLSQEEFSSRFGWKNDPAKVKIIETVKIVDKSAL